MDLSELYEQFEHRLHSFATSLTHDTDSADDLVQETLIRAMGHLDLLGQLNRHQRRAWLFRTLKNLYIDEQRRKQRQEQLLQQLGNSMALTQRVDALQMMVGIVQDAPPQHRELLYQRYILGMNSSEIAAEHGIPAATIRSRLHMARKWLQKHRDEFFGS